MNATETRLYAHAKTYPFDPSAFARLRRANLINVAGVAQGPAVAMLASSLAAFLFDDICDCCDTHEGMLANKEGLLNAQASGVPKRTIFLDICLLYDSICKPHPEVMWWMAGHDGVVTAFVDAFIAKFAICCTELEMEVSKDETEESTELT